MPLPSPGSFSSREKFVSACMEAQSGEDKPQDTKLAICFSTWKTHLTKTVVAVLRKAAITFGEAQQKDASRQAVFDFSNGLHQLVWSLEETLSSIVADETVDRAKKVKEALDDYMDAVASAVIVIPSAAEDVQLAKASLTVSKVDEDQRLVFGWFNLSTVKGEIEVDAHGEVIEPETLEKAAYNYVLNARVGGASHERAVGLLVESFYVDEAKEVAMVEALKSYGIEDAAINLSISGWWGGFYIVDDEAWAAVKSGEFPDFSIGGTATKEPV